MQAHLDTETTGDNDLPEVQESVLEQTQAEIKALKKKEYNRSYLAKNRDKMRAYNRAYSARATSANKRHARQRLYRAQNAEKIREQQRRYKKVNAARLREHRRAYRARNPSLWKAYDQLWNEQNRERRRLYSQQRLQDPVVRARKLELRQKAKLAAFVAYGGAFCKCCGETGMEFLSIDHINNGRGNPAKREGSLYYWLRKRGFPPGFQVLCHNCNAAKHLFGSCPHQRHVSPFPSL